MASVVYSVLKLGTEIFIGILGMCADQGYKFAIYYFIYKVCQKLLGKKREVINVF